MPTNTGHTIKHWSEEDRPREKLMTKGRAALTDAELLAILLGSGNRDQTAVGLAQTILGTVDHNLNELGKQTLADFMKFKGIGEAKAITIAAALELGRRRASSVAISRPKITCSTETYEYIAPLLEDYRHEEFWVIYLNSALRVLSKQRISQGGVSATIADVRIILKLAIEQLASSMILVHNHPSGATKPSKADRNLTEKLVSASKLMDIKVNDHVIIGEQGYYSFSDEGLLD